MIVVPAYIFIFTYERFYLVGVSLKEHPFLSFPNDLRAEVSNSHQRDRINTRIEGWLHKKKITSKFDSLFSIQ